MGEHKKVTLQNIGRGVAIELFARELERVLANMKDQNTPAKAKRKITLEFVFVPHEDSAHRRDEFSIEIGSKCTLAPVIQARSMAYFGREDGAVIALTNDVRQEALNLQSDGVTPMNQAAASA